MTRSAFGQIPQRLRGVAFVHPWVVPWFAIAACVIGIPGTLGRPPGTWVAILTGVVVCVGGSTAIWFAVRKKASGNGVLGGTLGAQIIVITAASIVAHYLNPVESFASESSDTLIVVKPEVSSFLIISLAVVWILTWVLVALLVSFHRDYRSSRRRLRAALGRMTVASERFTHDVLEPIHKLELDVAAQLRESATRLQRIISRNDPARTDRVRGELTNARDGIVSPALKQLSTISLDEDAPASPVRTPRAALKRVSARWNGRYFSGAIGALVIGIVAIASSTSINVTSPGFYVQIPLIMIAFFVSVPAALLLFFAAALTPFLGPGSNAPENYVFFVVIIVLALLSFLQRANEVRQLRHLESLSVTNSSISLEFVRFRQEANTLKKRLSSVLHGKVQSALVVAENHLTSRAQASDDDVERLSSTLREASDDLSATSSRAEVNFSSSIAEVVNLWDGAMKVEVSVAPEAEEILVGDSHAAATAIEVISEGTLNAAKHASTSRVSAAITAAGSRLRVAVTNVPENSKAVKTAEMSTQLGLSYLRQLTSELRIEYTENSTTLYAEIPARIELGESASG